MKESLFQEYVQKHFARLIGEITRRVNTSEEGYMFKNMLRMQYTPTLTWSSLSKDGQKVVADVVSMDSSLPLKRRSKIEGAGGKVPKLGMMKYLGEEKLTYLDILERQNSNGQLDRQFVSELFDDTGACLTGIYEQQEAMFLQGFSTGVTSIGDPENEGAAIRLDYGYPTENQVDATADWSGGTADPIGDIKAIRKLARKKSVSLRYMFMGEDAFDNFVNADGVKELYAAQIGFAGSNLPEPTKDQVNRALSAKYGLTVVVVDRSVTYEKNGVRTSKEPFDANNIVFTDTLMVGTNTWGTLAEVNHPAEHVKYVQADQYILMSKYHEVNPLREFTSSQALAVPVINNVNSIFLLDSESGN